MQEHLGNDGTFWWFSFVALANFLCVFCFVPETKGRSLEEIMTYWTSGFKMGTAAVRPAEEPGD